MNYLKIYKTNLLLLLGILLGGLIGIYFPESSSVTYPIGKIYLNFLYVLVTPLVFFSVVTAIISNKQEEKAKKILFYGGITFLFLSLAASLIALFIGVFFPSMIEPNQINIGNNLSTFAEKSNISEKIIKMLSVQNIPELFYSENMLPLLLFSFIVAVSMRKIGDPVKVIKDFFVGMTELLYGMISLIMKMAPIGLGCYFSYSISQTGAAIITSYGKVFLGFLLFSGFFYIIFYNIAIYLFAGKDKLKSFWKFSIVPSLTAIATASSSACIPANLEACDRLEIDHDVSRAIIPLGASLHKDGATGASVLKILLVLSMCHIDYMNIETLFMVILTSILSGIVMGTVPGGGVSAAALTVSIFSLPDEVLPIIILLSTIFDIPATLLNSVGNIPSAIIVERLLKKNKSIPVNKVAQ